MSTENAQLLYFLKCARCERRSLATALVEQDGETIRLCALCRSDDEGWNKLVDTLTRKQEAQQNIVDISTARAERLLGAQVAGEAISVEDPEICS